jgi:hypothetical protein
MQKLSKSQVAQVRPLIAKAQKLAVSKLTVAGRKSPFIADKVSAKAGRQTLFAFAVKHEMAVDKAFWNAAKKQVKLS